MEVVNKSRYHFLFVHGGCHGAWCWYKVVTNLRSDGYRATAIDLAAAGTNPKHVEEIVSMADYTQPLIDFMAALPPEERVVIVGHSLGGISISIAMEKFREKIAVAVFVTALMPAPGCNAEVVINETLSNLPLMDNKFSFVNDNAKTPASLLLGPECLASTLYQLCPPEDLILATLSLRAQPLVGISNWVKEADLTKGNYGSIRRAFVVCDQDNCLKRGNQEWLIENNPPDKVVVIHGADHMVMLSKPTELCECLRDLAERYW